VTHSAMLLVPDTLNCSIREEIDVGVAEQSIDRAFRLHPIGPSGRTLLRPPLDSVCIHSSSPHAILMAFDD
jgi:hypothetical protein